MTAATDNGGGDAKARGARTAARLLSLENGRAADPAVVVDLGIDEPARRVYNPSTTPTGNRMLRVWAAYIPADEYAELIALLRGEQP